MKSIFISLLGVVSIFTGATALADLLGEEDDAYIGFQITVPVAVSHSKLISGRNEYSVLFISQQDGIRDGLVFTRDTNGNKTLGYLKPTPTYRIDQRRLVDYRIPIVDFSAENEIRNNIGVVEGTVYLVAGIVAVSNFLNEVLEETVNCVDPDIESEEIAGC